MNDPFDGRLRVDQPSPGVGVVGARRDGAVERPQEHPRVREQVIGPRIPLLDVSGDGRGRAALVRRLRPRQPRLVLLGVPVEHARHLPGHRRVREAIGRRGDRRPKFPEQSSAVPDCLADHGLSAPVQLRRVGDARVDEVREFDEELHRRVAVAGTSRVVGCVAAEEFGLDILLNNAGIFGPRGGFGRIAYEDWLQVFNVNTLAPMRVAETFARHLQKADDARLVNVSSKLGSIGANEGSGSHIYRSSKAALNMVTKCLSIDLREREVIVAAMHPGHVSTDMGGKQAPLAPADSVAGMLQVIQRLSVADSGGFYGHDGTQLPW